MSRDIDYIASIRRDAAAIVALCESEPGRAIPSCPEWTAADLAGHIVDTFKGAIAGLETVEETDPSAVYDTALKLLASDPTPARDVAHECAIHRWDASRAFGADFAIDPDLSADGIISFFEDAWPMLLAYLKRPAGSGQTLHLQSTDGAGDWVVTLNEHPAVSLGKNVADVTVSGTASDLFLWLWGRFDPPSIEGDRAVLEGMRNPTGRFLSPGF